MRNAKSGWLGSRRMEWWSDGMVCLKGEEFEEFEVVAETEEDAVALNGQVPGALLAVEAPEGLAGGGVQSVKTKIDRAFAGRLVEGVAQRGGEAGAALLHALGVKELAGDYCAFAALFGFPQDFAGGRIHLEENGRNFFKADGVGILDVVGAGGGGINVEHPLAVELDGADAKAGQTPAHLALRQGEGGENALIKKVEGVGSFGGGHEAAGQIAGGEAFADRVAEFAVEKFMVLFVENGQTLAGDQQIHGGEGKEGGGAGDFALPFHRFLFDPAAQAHFITALVHRTHPAGLA